jgi:L-cystine uptake protein TcyP (sodium:dicarboxylate symporter family)
MTTLLPLHTLILISRGICIYLFIGFVFSIVMTKLWKKDARLREKIVYSLLWPITIGVIIHYIVKHRKDEVEESL